MVSVAAANNHAEVEAAHRVYIAWDRRADVHVGIDAETGHGSAKHGIHAAGGRC